MSHYRFAQQFSQPVFVLRLARMLLVDREIARHISCFWKEKPVAAPEEAKTTLSTRRLNGHLKDMNSAYRH